MRQMAFAVLLLCCGCDSSRGGYPWPGYDTLSQDEQLLVGTWELEYTMLRTEVYPPEQPQTWEFGPSGSVIRIRTLQQGGREREQTIYRVETPRADRLPVLVFGPERIEDAYNVYAFGIDTIRVLGIERKRLYVGAYGIADLPVLAFRQAD